jgi:hypothetical protein
MTGMVREGMAREFPLIWRVELRGALIRYYCNDPLKWSISKCS